MPSKQFTPDQSLSRQTQSTGKFQYVPLPKYDIQVHKHWVLPVSCNVSPTCLPVSSYWNILSLTETIWSTNNYCFKLFGSNVY